MILGEGYGKGAEGQETGLLERGRWSGKGEGGNTVDDEVGGRSADGLAVYRYGKTTYGECLGTERE